MQSKKYILYRWETSTCTRTRNATPTTSSSFLLMTWYGAGTSVSRNLTTPIDVCPSSSLMPTTTGRREGSPLSRWSLELDSPKVSITRWVKTCKTAHKMVQFSSHDHFKGFHGVLVNTTTKNIQYWTIFLEFSSGSSIGKHLQRWIGSDLTWRNWDGSRYQHQSHTGAMSLSVEQWIIIQISHEICHLQDNVNLHVQIADCKSHSEGSNVFDPHQGDLHRKRAQCCTIRCILWHRCCWDGSQGIGTVIELQVFTWVSFSWLKLYYFAHRMVVRK